MSVVLIRAIKKFDLVHCTYDPGEANEDMPSSETVGHFETRKEAKREVKRLGGSLLTALELSKFWKRIGTSGYVIEPHLYVASSIAERIRAKPRPKKA